MKRNKLPSLITVLILTLVTTVMWVSLSIYRAFSQKPTPSVPQEIVNPLTPTLDQKTMTQIGSSVFLDDSQIPEITITKPGSPAPQATATTAATPTPISTPVPATGSGTTTTP